MLSTLSGLTEITTDKNWRIVLKNEASNSLQSVLCSRLLWNDDLVLSKGDDGKEFLEKLVKISKGGDENKFNTHLRKFGEETASKYFFDSLAETLDTQIRASFKMSALLKPMFSVEGFPKYVFDKLMEANREDHMFNAIRSLSPIDCVYVLTTLLLLVPSEKLKHKNLLGKLKRAGFNKEVIDCVAGTA